MASSTMTTMTTLLFSLVLLSYIAHADQSYCPASKVGSTQTGRVVESKPEWKVEIYNPCPCSVSHLKLWSEPRDFESVVPIDPSVLRKDNTGKFWNWIVNNDLPLAGQKTFSFTYVGDAVQFRVFHKAVACP